MPARFNKMDGTRYAPSPIRDPSVSLKKDKEQPGTYIYHLPLAGLTRVLPPGRIECYNQLFCLCGQLGGLSEIQTSLDVSDL